MSRPDSTKTAGIDMRMRSPTIAPSDEPIHFVLCDFGRQGIAYVETEPVKTEREVVDNILRAQYDRPLEVLSVSVSEGWARDVTEDVAGRVVERARAEGIKLSEGARNFVEKHLDEELEPELCA